MTSAILSNIHEGQWGEHKAYTRNFTHHNTNFSTLNPNPNSTYNSAGIGRVISRNPNPSRHSQNFTNRDHVRESDEPPVRYSAPPVAVSSDSYRMEKESSRDGHVIFHLDSYSTSELKELKARFVSDLERVRRFICQIEAREPEFRSKDSVPLQVNNSVWPVNSVDLPKVKKGASVKKSGKISGQKRTMPVSSNREAKRPAKAAVLNSTATRKVEAAMMRRCGQILTKLMKHKHGWVFNKPVDAVALGLHNYHQVIKHPMDLGTVKVKLGQHIYGTPLDFASDVRLIFDNAMTYNPRGDDAHTMASILLNMFDEMFNPAYRKFEAERQRIIVAQQNYSKPLPKLAQSQVVSSQRNTEKPLQMLSQTAFSDAPPIQTLGAKICKETVKKSVSVQQRTVPEMKANTPIRREMSHGEREKLGLILQDFAGECLDEILQIVAKRNSELAAPGGDGEIELDVHAIDSETMWDLDRFVRLHKMAAQNRMRKEELTCQSTLTLENNKSPDVMVQEPAIPSMLKVDEDIDIGDEMPMNDYPPLEIERDDAPSPASNVGSSNSSSSSSGTDSSDSDSSSGSESEDSVQSHDATFI